LNGTYVNRQRIERAGLVNGDELQIGRFKLVFFSDPTGHPDDVG
jgi:pSer/pThr/pTyr-binding forkhead associated (FHA) protein